MDLNASIQIIIIIIALRQLKTYIYKFFYKKCMNIWQ